MGQLAKRLAALGLAGVLVTGGVFIVSHEGYVPGTYVDPAGIVTACYGHAKSLPVPGIAISEHDCLNLLAQDLSGHHAELMNSVQVPLSEGEHVAYLSFHYNIGGAAFRQSTLLKLLNQDQREAACNELPRWVYAGGKRLAGLERRRAEEQRLCLEGVHGANEATGLGSGESDCDNRCGWLAVSAYEQQRAGSQARTESCEGDDEPKAGRTGQPGHHARAKRRVGQAIASRASALR